jgi:hypothetical protein
MAVHHVVRHLDGDHTAVSTDLALGRNGGGDHNFAPGDLLDRSSNLQGDPEWGGTEIIHVQ